MRSFCSLKGRESSAYDGSFVGPVGPRDVIYTKTRLRTPSTDQSSRRPPHRIKCTHAASYLIGRYPGKGSTFTRGHCVFSNHTKAPG
ncbi:UNVERIFIED_CONTAM: hypothetical protein NCL1_41578 [Trichonephila clavipes]